MLSGATRRIYNWCPLCGYKVRKNRKPSRLHHNICSNRSFVPFGWCRVCYQEHQLDPSIVASSEFCFKTPSEHLITSRQTWKAFSNQPVMFLSPKEIIVSKRMMILSQQRTEKRLYNLNRFPEKHTVF